MEMQTKPLVGRRIKAADLVKAITDPAQMKLQRPETPKPSVAIESMSVIGKDKLRAGDQAIYEIFWAWAREQDVENDKYEIPAAYVRSYLAQGEKGDGHAHNDRLVDALERLSTTHVRYAVRDDAFRERGTVPLVTARLFATSPPASGQGSSTSKTLPVQSPLHATHRERTSNPFPRR
ncbi:hypothetical protein [Mesorhizobium sp. A556]